MADLPVTSLTIIDSGDITNINSAALYLVNGGNSRQVFLPELFRVQTRPPLAMMTIVSCIGFPNASWTQITFDTESFDDVGGVDIANTPTLITVQTDIFNYARVTAKTNWTGNGTGNRYYRIEHNGSTVGGNANGANNESFRSTVTQYLAISSGDYFGMYGWQSSGATLGLQGAGFGGVTFMQVEFFR